MSKVAYIAIIVFFFYIFTSAEVVSDFDATSMNVVTGNAVVEKTIKETECREEKVPYSKPRMGTFPYNFTKELVSFDERFEDNKEIITCTFKVTNLEEESGLFNFYAQVMGDENIR